MTAVALLVAASLTAQEPALLVPPTLQLGHGPKPGVSSLALVWQTSDSSHAYEVRFQTGDGWRKAAPTFRRIAVDGVRPHRFYEATLTDLKRGRDLEFVLFRNGIRLAAGKASIPPTETQRFVVFGDFGAASPAEAQVVYRAYQAKPQLAVLTGDLVYDRGTVRQYRTNFYPYLAAARPDLKKGAPFLQSTLTVGAIGNHDALGDLDQYPDHLGYYYYWSQPLNGPDPGRSATPVRGSADRLRAFRNGFTQIDLHGKTLRLKQIGVDGKVLDSILLTK